MQNIQTHIHTLGLTTTFLSFARAMVQGFDPLHRARVRPRRVRDEKVTWRPTAPNAMFA